MIEGIETNVFFQYQLLNEAAFVEGKFDTSFIERNLETILGGVVDEA